ncbi:BTB/POZ domain-containing protein At2g46260 isoform X2 [Cryptomeria japonica]|uniref:BTB/POZ domain-containing protein At2g46260 isoform X2 n=1 Tax=Cryptomeria japonica TaxID=3369 RepID=UPI0025AD2087|nr:BTB/POZ domain-containing protein At2g46260 isoform X2 [Cryptomeria japonica]
MEDHTIRLASDYFKSSQYPRWLDRTLRVHVCNPVQGFPGRITEDNIVETLTIPVYSVTLTKESEYFQKLFGSGFREASGHVVDIYIAVKEKEAFQQILLLCTDASDISLTDVEELLTLWNLSDRLMFKRSCLYAVKTLTNTSLTWQQCIIIIEKSFQFCSNQCQTKKLVEKCTRTLIDHFQDLHFLKSRIEEDQVLLNELKALPLSALEALLSSDHLPVQREEVTFYGMVIWAQHNAATREEEQQLMTKMAVHIRFPFMKPEVLSTLTEICEMGDPVCQQFLVEALKYRAASDEMKEKYRSEAVGHSRFRWRIGYYKPIKVITLEHPRKQATVHMSVLLDDLEAMITDGVLEYESFNLSGNRFCFRIIQTSSPFVAKKRIGLEMLLKNNSFARIRCDIRVSMWSQVQMKFVNKFREFHTFEAENTVFSYPDLLSKDWKEYTQVMDCERKIYICVEFLVNNLD